MDNLLVRGEPPWSPTPRVSNLDVWHVDDVPTVGTFELDGQAILFAAIGPVTGLFTVWAYRALDGELASAVAEVQFDDEGDMHAYVDTAFTDCDLLVASATHLRLDHWTPFRGAENVYVVANQFLDWIIRDLEGDATQRHFSERREQIEQLVDA